MPDDPNPSQQTEVTTGDVRTGDINAQIVTVGHESKVIIEKFYASDPAKLRERRDLLLLAEKVWVFWVEGVLEKSLHGAAMLALGMEVQTGAVSGPWGMVVRKGAEDGERVPPGQPMIETFFKLGRALLILGAPGSGKTTTLLELARDLCLLAERDPANPVPVVFNLSSWGEHRGRLLDWLVREFKDQYGVPKKMAQGWLEAGALTLLLDGLDEVPAAQRDACVAAINDYRGEHGLAGMAVCSRTGDYGELAEKLKLDNAVVIEPLTDAQGGGYLAVGGERMAGLRAALEKDEGLREMARSPLMLSVMSLAYQDAGAGELATLAGDSETGKRQVFGAYVARMFGRRARAHAGDYSDEETIGWLRWLAKRMIEHGESPFLIERLQPSWLSDGRRFWLYMLVSRMLGGVAIGLVWVLLAFFVGIFEESGPGASDALTLFLLFGFTGIMVGVLDGIRLKHIVRWRAVPSRRGNSWQTDANLLLIALMGSLVGALSCTLLVNFKSLDGESLFYGLILIGLPLGLRGRRQTLHRDIRTSENISWSLREFLVPTLAGLVLAGLSLLATYRFSDPGAYLWDAQGNRLAKMWGHFGYVESASFSPDGTRIITTGSDNTARLWDTEGNQIAVLEDHRERVTSASFSPDGTRILTASDDKIARLWDAEGNLVARLTNYSSIRLTSFSPDGTRIITTSFDSTARLWDLEGNSTGVLYHKYFVSSASFSPDGTHILTASGDDAYLWDADGKQIAVLTGHTDAIISASFSPDGTRIVTASTDNTARLWDAESNQIAVLAGHGDWVLSANFNPDGTQIITASRDNTARLWDAEGDLVTILRGHTDDVRSASFSQDGTQIITTSRDNTARLWDAEGDLVTVLVLGYANRIWSTSFSPDGTRIVTTSAVADYRLLSIILLFIGLFIGLFWGIRSSIQETSTQPNQGIWLSVRYTAIVGSIAGLAVVLPMLSIIMLIDWSEGFSSPLNAIWSPLWLGMFGFVGLLAALWFGLLDVIQHFTLRAILTHAGHIPWRYGHFLNHAAGLILLRKVGGGYIFVHRYLLEYFAGLEAE